jgi:hypothetical protein
MPLILFSIFQKSLKSSQIVRFQSKHAAKTISYRGYENLSYARQMGFFNAFKLEESAATRGSNYDKTYIPINIKTCQGIIDRAYDKGIEVGDEVEAECRKMAKILSGANSGNLYDYLTYSFRELMRNVVEHSRSSQIAYCAQYWPSKKRVELAIIDRGIGLMDSLKKNPHIDPSDDKKAINYALMPAISSTSYKGARKQYGNWANSGFGLYMTNRICRNGGSFFIASGKTGMLLSDKSEGKRYFDCDFQGTAARMIIKTEKIGHLNDCLKKYREEGYEIQKQYRELVRLEPSAASLMLSEDFSEPMISKILARIRGNK